MSSYRFHWGRTHVVVENLAEHLNPCWEIISSLPSLQSLFPLQKFRFNIKDWSKHWNIFSQLADVLLSRQKEKHTASVILQSYSLHCNAGTLLQVLMLHKGGIQRVSLSNLITAKLQELQLILSNDLIKVSSLSPSQSSFPSLTYSIGIHPSFILQVGKFLRKQEQVNLSSRQEQFISSDKSKQVCPERDFCLASHLSTNEKLVKNTKTSHFLAWSICYINFRLKSTNILLL